MVANSLGHQAQLAVDSVAPVDTSSEPYEFESESMSKKRNVVDTNAIRGTRSHAKERVRFGTNEVGGSIVLFPSPLDLDNWLPRILGAAESSDVFGLSETLPEFVMMIDKVADAFLYSGCKVSKATFAGASGQPVKLTLDVMALSETAGQSFPSLTLGVTDADDPYVMSDGVLTLAGSAVSFRSFELSIDNAVTADFRNSVDATALDEGDRVVTLNAEVAWDSTNESALYSTSVEGIAGNIKFTNGNVSTLFTFGSLQPEDNTPVVGSKERIPFNFSATARMSGSTRELVVTNDSVSSS